MMLEDLAVGLIVAAAIVFVVWRFLPAPARVVLSRRGAGVARAAGMTALAARFDAAASGTGAGGACGACNACAPRAGEGAPLRQLHPHDLRGPGPAKPGGGPGCH